MTRARVCLAQSVICSDVFLDLPLCARALYPCLLLEADNDGALDSPKRVARTYGATQDDIEALLSAGYLIDAGGVLFITDWHVHNTKDKHNYRPGNHQDALKHLIIDVNRRYVLSDLHQSDNSLSSAPNTIQIKSSELNAKQFNSDGIESSRNADFGASNAPNQLQACPKCGKSDNVKRAESGMFSCSCGFGWTAKA